MQGKRERELNEGWQYNVETGKEEKGREEKTGGKGEREKKKIKRRKRWKGRKNGRKKVEIEKRKGDEY